MAKFCGVIGYTISTDEGNGIWVDNVVERTYMGDILRHNWNYETSEGVNDNINLSNEISIVADPFACDNFHAMKYVVYRGTKWKIRSVREEPPRLILTLGGVYNGK